jgi:transcriptional regulator with XRE-family HTH domain
MTLGEKIKDARKKHGLSQEQLAEKMAVSRSAVAKWEANNGLPDLENLKALASLLNVSIDYLLDDGETLSDGVIREPYDLADYGRGSKKKRKDRVIRQKYPNGEIHPLLGKQKLTKSEKVVDNLLGLLTDAPFGTSDLINSCKHADKAFYLIRQEEKQFFVTVTDEFIESRLLTRHITADKFEIGSWQFIKCAYQVK